VAYRYDKTPVTGEISEYKSIVRFHKVDETKWESFWNDLVKEHHYLGYESVIGARVKYIVTFGKQIVGAMSFCSAAYKLGARDKWIGWNEETKNSLLPHLVCNNRFLILPWITVKNLASHILSQSFRQLRQDWEKQYEIKPYMVETFVDRKNFLGTCYKAANWTYLGITKGYSRQGNTFVYHGEEKDIYAYIIDKSFAKRFKPDTGRLYNEREELLEMINGIPMWYPSLLKNVGITENSTEQIREFLGDHLLPYVPYIGRKENREHFIAMEQGLLSDLDRKSIEPIALAFEGVDGVRNLTNFMSRSKWDDKGMLKEYQSDLSGILAHEEGMITGDETCFPKKGNNSVGVARQYCGRLGKVDNCQSGVMAGYTSPNGYGLVDYELYMPKSWFEDNHEKLRKKCKLPENLKFQGKSDMLLERIQSIVKSGKFPAKYVGVDSFFGSDSNFLDSLPEGMIYFADIHSNIKVFTERPSMALPAYSGRGRKPLKEKPDIPPQSVREIAEKSELPWNDVVLGIGAKGPIISKDKCLRVIEIRDGKPGKDVWLYIRQLEDGSMKYSLCNAPMDAAFEDIRKLALMRWPIEQCFKECKEYLGMDHCEARSWDAWHRHILLTFIAHLFIIKLRMEFSCKPQAPGVAPYIEKPVSLDDYIEASGNMKKSMEIQNPNIFTMPNTPQQIMTIGLIRKLVSASLIKVGALFDEINYSLYTAAAAFESHSRTALKKARLIYAEQK